MRVNLFGEDEYRGFHVRMGGGKREFGFRPQMIGPMADPGVPSTPAGTPGQDPDSQRQFYTAVYAVSGDTVLYLADTGGVSLKANYKLFFAGRGFLRTLTVDAVNVTVLGDHYIKITLDVGVAGALPPGTIVTVLRNFDPPQLVPAPAGLPAQPAGLP